MPSNDDLLLVTPSTTEEITTTLTLDDTGTEDVQVGYKIFED